MNLETLPNKILKKKCPRCAAEMVSHIPDDEMLKMAIRLFKTTICIPCGNFQLELNRIDELKQETWGILARLSTRANKLKKARTLGSKTPNLSMTIAKLEEEIKTTRTGLEKLKEKEEKVLSKRGLHEQQLKERN